MLKLYNMPLALNCYKVRLLLSLLKVPYEKHSVDLLTGDHQTPEYLALNPFGQVPMLSDGAVLLRDSQAILVWLARKFGGERWMPVAALGHASVCAQGGGVTSRLLRYKS